MPKIGIVILILLTATSVNAEEFYDKYYANKAKLKNCEMIITDETFIGGRVNSRKICFWDIGDGREMWTQVGTNIYGFTK